MDIGAGRSASAIPFQPIGVLGLGGEIISTAGPTCRKGEEWLAFRR